MKTDKEKLSEYVEEIFKRYTSSGLHICDIATGGGKSYTISKLTCEYYPKEFNRIVILCVQKKLVEGINREINEFRQHRESRQHDGHRGRLPREYVERDAAWHIIHRV